MKKLLLSLAAAAVFILGFYGLFKLGLYLSLNEITQILILMAFIVTYPYLYNKYVSKFMDKL